MTLKTLALCCAVALVGTLHAGGDADIASIQLGNQLQGPSVSAEGLRGKAVLLDFWGTH